MPIVTGTLTEIDGGHLTGKHPELIFALNQTAITADVVYPTEPAKVTPGADGTFSVDLVATEGMLDDAWYTLAVRWLDSAGNMSRIDYPEWRIRVPATGGAIGNLRGPASNLSMVYVSTTPPGDPSPFMLWLEQDPANPDPYDPLNTGKLYRWENI